MQMRFDRMYDDFSGAREVFEADTHKILQNQVLGAAPMTAEVDGVRMKRGGHDGVADLPASVPDATSMDAILSSRADAAVKWLWSQSDELFAKYASNGGGVAGYPAWWLASPEVGYEAPKNKEYAGGEEHEDAFRSSSSSSSSPPHAAAEEKGRRGHPDSVPHRDSMRGSDMFPPPSDGGRSTGSFEISKVVPQLRRYYRYFSTGMKVKRPSRGN
eukprot:CAMPEP_0185258348 /NCGR_PEP_ID=MMETSP1359-20130426/7282_1 /TAXON_ID=552665 /ORGANISM="Bigelowiella longifila, Strain CCMP242" /LENGTH=214 /DNA_ID=CAMNT_0027843805 /DNA_START=77 /DNA_END=721 /DNA_ORIENTATION=+